MSFAAFSRRSWWKETASAQPSAQPVYKGPVRNVAWFASRIEHDGLPVRLSPKEYTALIAELSPCPPGGTLKSVCGIPIEVDLMEPEGGGHQTAALGAYYRFVMLAERNFAILKEASHLKADRDALSPPNKAPR